MADQIFLKKGKWFSVQDSVTMDAARSSESVKKYSPVARDLYAFRKSPTSRLHGSCLHGKPFGTPLVRFPKVSHIPLAWIMPARKTIWYSFSAPII